LSFFDEVDEPPAEPPTAERRRPTGGGRRPPGGQGPTRPGGPRPGDDQTIRVRRAVALVALVVVLILIVVGVHSCQVSQANGALKDYTVSVSALMQSSDQTSKQLFGVLTSGQGTSNATNLQSQIDEARLAAANQLSRAQSLSAPDSVKGAQQNLVLTMQMRVDAISDIAQQIQPALQPQTSADADNSVAGEMARFYASDVLYKNYVLPPLVGALHNAGIAVGGANGEPIFAGQFLPDIQWLTPSFVAAALYSPGAPATGPTKVAPGLHGHALNSVSVGGTTLQTGSTNSLTASPAPTFTLNFTNTGQNTETNVVCKVTVSASNISGQTVVPKTTAGQTTSCKVTLASAPPAGSATVKATVQPVPGEKNAANNTLSFPVTFK
jgi:hypothetical protein